MVWLYGLFFFGLFFGLVWVGKYGICEIGEVLEGEGEGMWTYGLRFEDFAGLWGRGKGGGWKGKRKEGKKEEEGERGGGMGI